MVAYICGTFNHYVFTYPGVDSHSNGQKGQGHSIVKDVLAYICDTLYSRLQPPPANLTPCTTLFANKKCQSLVPNNLLFKNGTESDNLWNAPAQIFKSAPSISKIFVGFLRNFSLKLFSYNFKNRFENFTKFPPKCFSSKFVRSISYIFSKFWTVIPVRNVT